ncbi:MAG: ABC transporter ATP-binding protein [Deltaproteobacteria bacterium]|nr:MAG: ABC transporter ATP-binding protein [Deltaproteobacteria bacterium]
MRNILNTTESRDAIKIRNLSMAFGGLVAFEGVNLNIPEGQILGLIGPNGAGKTTLINCITGVYKPTTGEILFYGTSLINLRPHQICRLGIGRTFQIPRPFMNMTVLQNLQVCARQGQVDYKELLDLVGLWSKRDRLAKTLTFQERRLLELSRALAVKPRLVLLDEVLAGLNPTETAEMTALLRRVHAEFKVTIIWIEHVMKAIMENAQKIVVLHQGSIIAQGEPRQIANNPKVIEAYLGEEYHFAE